jgi:hypothetical protein
MRDPIHLLTNRFDLNFICRYKRYEQEPSEFQWHCACHFVWLINKVQYLDYMMSTLR